MAVKSSLHYLMLCEHLTMKIDYSKKAYFWESVAVLLIKFITSISHYLPTKVYTVFFGIQKHSSQLHNCFNDGNLNPVSIIQVTCHNFQSFCFSVFELGNDGENYLFVIWRSILSATTKPSLESHCPMKNLFNFQKTRQIDAWFNTTFQRLWYFMELWYWGGNQI